MIETAPHTNTSLGRLAEVALQQGFADQCTLTRDSLVLVIEGRTFTFGWADGLQFLRLLLGGASGFGVSTAYGERDRAQRAEEERAQREQAQREEGDRVRAEQERLRRERAEREQAERERVERERVERERAEAERAQRDRPERGVRTERAVAGRPAGSPRQGRLRDDYLDTMLTFAARAGLIEGFDKDEAQHKVTLRTNATTTDLSYAETLEYLTSVVLDELSTVQTSGPAVRSEDRPIISILPTR